MDDRSIVSDRERRIEEEVEAEKRGDNRLPVEEQDDVTTTRVESDAPTGVGGAGASQSTAASGRLSDMPGASMPAAERMTPDVLAGGDAERVKDAEDTAG